MDASARLAKSHNRLSSILQDIDASIGRSGALHLVDEAGNSNVPYGLRQGVARTALFMLQEMSMKSAAAHHERLKQKHQDYKASLPDEHEHKNISFNKFKKLDREKRGALGKGSPRKGIRKRRKRGDAPSTPRKRSSKKSGGDPRPPAPPAAGAQAVGGDKPTPARKEADKKKSPDMPEGMTPKELRARLDKKKGKLPSERGPYKGMPRREKLDTPEGQEKIAALFKKRIKQGETSKSGRESRGEKGEIQDKIRRMKSTLRSVFDPDVPGDRRAQPGRPTGRRFSPGHHWYDDPEHPMQDPDHPLEPFRHQTRDDFKRHSSDRERELDDLSKDAKERGLGRGRRGQPGHRPRELRGKASKLFRMRLKHPAHRDREQDTAKGYSPREHPRWAGHHVDPDTGKTVHSSGKKENKKFANSTTFGNTDDDAMLHTDKDKSGARGSADKDEFVFHGDLDKDPRQKWFRVSKDGGYASAMGSLGAAYHAGGDVKGKVIDKVRSTGFTDADGHQVHVRPTGGLHDARPECKKNPDGSLTARGRALKSKDSKEFYRLCKGIHGPADEGERKQKSAERNEYQRGFDPQHDNRKKLLALHRAAESGKAAIPHKKIQARKARRGAG